MWQSILGGAKYFARLVGVAIIVWTVVLAPSVLFAQVRSREGTDDGSCAIEYERAAILAYDRLDRCVQGSNNMPWYQRGVERFVCNAEYISDSLQYAAMYSACMAPVKSLFNR